MTIGERIRHRRKQMKMSAEELGRRIGKDRSTIFRYEKGEIEKMPIDVLEPIAKELDTTPQYLMGWSEVQKNNDVISDIVVRMRKDSVFFEVVSSLNELDEKKLSNLLEFLK